jgi:hypothetical protein
MSSGDIRPANASVLQKAARLDAKWPLLMLG